ncbi:unnamed protein product [Angiostrongylus costaricensis]|uniref:DUF1801 domain-containing protein n=1 Tax=Angiostrongylus costaricensis TaxID=334426 RepID=A0A0R3PAE1_ANGCS|nr:unnamed protein product [Angiostrongylus costaricensis]
MIRRIIEDVSGGSWGVLIIRNPELVSYQVHWTIPEHNNVDGSPGFCLSVIKGWQYNVFKTGSKDYEDRVTVNSLIERLRLDTDKPKPRRMTVKQFDQLLARALQIGGVQ